MEHVKIWISSIIIGVFVINMISLILPNTLKEGVNLIIRFIFVLIVITPIVSLFSKNVSLEDMVLNKVSDYNQKYNESITSLTEKTGTSADVNSYKNTLKEILTLKLQSEGYDLEEIEFDGNDISNIKIIEKNSNTEDNSSIEFNKEEEVKQAFKDNDGSKEQSASKTDELKDDLIKILDVSIETIEID